MTNTLLIGLNLLFSMTIGKKIEKNDHNTYVSNQTDPHMKISDYHLLFNLSQLDPSQSQDVYYLLHLTAVEL